MPEAHRQFLANLKLSHHEPGLFFSHAGIDPTKGLDEQTAETLLYGDSAMFDFDHDWLAQNLRQRLGAKVVHGHWSDIGGVVESWPHRAGIDTGAGYLGGHLTAVAIQGDVVEVLS
jgi:serine/threonine protein phosphatase 1